jgi:hypothetical protein
MKGMPMLESQRERVPLDDGGERDTALAFLSFGRSCVLKKLQGWTHRRRDRPLIERRPGRTGNQPTAESSCNFS